MTLQRSIALIGVPADTGGAYAGCLMGPDALRTADIVAALSDLGHAVDDFGNFHVVAGQPRTHPNAAVHDLASYAALIDMVSEICQRSLDGEVVPIFMGGDHSIAAGTLPGIARRAREEGREQFVLWLDAHPDLHTLHSTKSGNLHGTPVAYATGAPGFEDALPALDAPIRPESICMMGIRSVDPAERAHIAATGITVHDMRAIDEFGIAAPLRAFLERVRAANGRLHVSLDVDFLDPEIAPAVATTVPGGATFREAHLVMEMLHDSGFVSSLDIVELNPFLDERGRTAKLIVDLVASLFGRQVLDRRTRSF